MAFHIRLLPDGHFLTEMTRPFWSLLLLEAKYNFSGKRANCISLFLFGLCLEARLNVRENVEPAWRNSMALQSASQHFTDLCRETQSWGHSPLWAPRGISNVVTMCCWPHSSSLKSRGPWILLAGSAWLQFLILVVHTAGIKWEFFEDLMSCPLVQSWCLLPPSTDLTPLSSFPWVHGLFYTFVLSHIFLVWITTGKLFFQNSDPLILELSN